MRIYLAAPYHRRFEMLGVAASLMRAGHDVTSRWIEGGQGGAASGDPQQVVAIEDLDDLHRADCVVTFTARAREAAPARTPRSRGDVELGFALATGKRLCVVGPRETALHHLRRVEVYTNVAAFIDGLQAGAPDRD